MFSKLFVKFLQLISSQVSKICLNFSSSKYEGWSNSKICSLINHEQCNVGTWNDNNF